MICAQQISACAGIHQTLLAGVECVNAEETYIVATGGRDISFEFESNVTAQSRNALARVEFWFCVRSLYCHYSPACVTISHIATLRHDALEAICSSF